MFDKEIIDWFNNYLDNCYYVKHDDFSKSLFMFYDVNYVRQLKLAKIEGIDSVEKTDVTGICLFELDLRYHNFYCNYELIWTFLRDKYFFDYSKFQTFVRYLLEKHPNYLKLTRKMNMTYESFSSQWSSLLTEKGELFPHEPDFFINDCKFVEPIKFKVLKIDNTFNLENNLSF